MMTPSNNAVRLTLRALFPLAFLSGAGCDTAAPEGALADPVEPTTLAECPSFAPRYARCEKTGGSQPPFFDSVEIEPHAAGFSFVTQTVQGPMNTEYIPDRVVRLGSDFHTLSDGTVLPDLPSLESSYCAQGELYRREFTALPDQTMAAEQITMWIGDEGELGFELIVDDETLLEAQCFE